MAFPNYPYPPLLVELRPSQMLAGEIGLFAARHIKNGTVIVSRHAFCEDVFISWQKWRSLDPVTRRKLYAFCPGDQNGIMAPADLNVLPIPWYINHSCEPNAGFNPGGDLVALLKIRRDTEITWDYSTLEHNPKFKMNCKCGSLHCRGIIRANISSGQL